MTLAENTDADRLLVRIARHGGWWLALLGGASLAGAAAQVLLPAAIGRALDAALTPHGGTRWLGWCTVLVAIIILTSVAVSLATGMASATAIAWLRRMLAAHVLGCGPGLLGQVSSGDTVSRLVGGTSDAGAAPASAVLAVDRKSVV